MRQSPGFASLVVLTLALGIGVNTAIFSVLYAVVLKPLPYPDSHRLVKLEESTPKAAGISVSWRNYQHWSEESRAFESMSGFVMQDAILTGRGDAELVNAASVTHEFLPLTGWQPYIGRIFTSIEDRPGAPPVVVLSFEFWSSRFSSDPGILGTSLTLSGTAYQVIGVLRPGLSFLPRPTAVYFPLGARIPQSTLRSDHQSMRVLAKLAPGATLERGREELSTLMKRLAKDDPGPEDDHRVTGRYLDELAKEGIGPTLWLMMGAVTLVLLLACANVASLLLVRSSARSRDFAIRSAMGAGGVRLAWQMLTEHLTMALAGGAMGLLLAAACLKVLRRSASSNIPRLAEVRLDWHVLLFCFAVTIVVAVLATLAPAYAIARRDVASVLKDGASGSGSGRGGNLFRNLLVVAEIAMTLVLLFGSSLLLRSLMAVEARSPGFDAAGVLALELQLPRASYPKPSDAEQFYSRLLEAVRAIPGVLEAGLTSCPPAAGSCWDWWYSVDGRPAPAQGEVPLSLFKISDAGYFRTLRIPLKAGRAFTGADQATSPKVAIVSETLARKWWDRPESAVGRQIKYGGPYRPGDSYEIVGVVGNIRQMALDEDYVAEVYLPLTQRQNPSAVIMIRTGGDPSALTSLVRRTVSALDHNLPIQSLLPLEEKLGTTLARRRFSAVLLSAFSSLAALLAAVGVFGVLNYWVRIRRKEIAIRIALGASPASILGWVGLHASRLTAAGVALGVAGGWFASRWLSTMVFGVSTRDPQIMLIAATIALVVAALAASLPMLRAMSVEAARNLHDA